MAATGDGRQRNHAASNSERNVRISDAARAIGVSPSTLRAWERQGWVVPERTAGNQRVYSAEVLSRLTDIRPLVQPQLRRVALNAAADSPVSSLEGLAGPRLRAMRIRKALSLRAVARAAEVSPAYLSSIERGLATPTVAVLQRIAAAVGTTVLEAFHDDGAERASSKVVRRSDRKAFVGFDGVEIEDLVRFAGAILQAEFFTIAPGGGSGGGYRHEGEEVIFVVEGTLLVWLDESERYDLEAGDTLYFRSEQAHRWQNQGSVPTKLLWVNTPPTF